MAWVDFTNIAVTRRCAGSARLASEFEREVMQPVDGMLLSVASPSCPHGPSMGALQQHAPYHMLPHLGLPYTRYTLRDLGVNVPAERTPEFPSLGICTDCWQVGVWN